MAQEQKPDGVDRNDRGLKLADTLITNPTDFTAHVHVRYASIICSDADPVIAPGGNWTEYRGICLVCEVAAQMQIENKLIRAASYRPLAFCTPNARFVIVKTGNDSFQINHQKDPPK